MITLRLDWAQAQVAVGACCPDPDPVITRALDGARALVCARCAGRLAEVVVDSDMTVEPTCAR